MSAIVWIVGGVILLAAVKAASEVRVERASTLSELVAATQAAATSEALLLQRETRQKERDAARDAEKNARDDAREARNEARDAAREARQEDQFSDWEHYRTEGAPLSFAINGREVCARVADVRVRGVVIQDGAGEHCFQSFEALQWVAATDALDALDDPSRRITPLPPPLPSLSPPDMEEYEEDREAFDG